MLACVRTLGSPCTSMRVQARSMRKAAAVVLPDIEVMPPAGDNRANEAKPEQQVQPNELGILSRKHAQLSAGEWWMLFPDSLHCPAL